MKCRHRNTWILQGGGMEWCSDCGAWRLMSLINLTSLAPNSSWCRPGDAYAEWHRRSEVYRERMEKKRGAK